MITQSLDLMKQKPGIYVLINGICVVFIEVDGDTIHQLQPDTFERDGVLSPDGWNHSTLWRAVGPLQRVPA